jgi:NAD-dependent deacetylase
MKKIAVFTGAGISAESGVVTFRDTKDGLWYNYKVEEVATIEGWEADRFKVLDFHNIVRAKLKDAAPNEAHLALKKLEEKFEVTIITQNIDDLHERAGSTNVLHLHGELLKSRSIKNPTLIYECLGDINIGDKCELGSQLRPHTVLFGEYPYNVDESYDAISTCDYLLIIGTSLQIGYTLNLLASVRMSENAKIFYIDPKPSKDLEYTIPIKYIKKKAVEGVTALVDKLMQDKI